MLTEQGPIKLLEYLTISNIYYDWSTKVFWLFLIFRSPLDKLYEQQNETEDNEQKLGLSTDLQ